MFHDEYGRRKNTIPLVLIILSALAIVAAIYFLFASNAFVSEIAAINAVDYSVKQLSTNYLRESGQLGVSLNERKMETLGDDKYMTPLGFPIVSYSDKWKGEKLVEIYHELLNNTHGSEINYISKVVVHPGKSEMGTSDRVVAGAHTVTTENYSVFFDIPALVPPSLKYSVSSTQSLIELYDMDAHDTIAQAARTIAHEYGHHYTMHYFLQSDEDAMSSEYYTLRGFKDYDENIFFDEQDEYLLNHQWSIYEIAAEDYVQLLGSPNAKHVKYYMDVYDVLLYSKDEVYYVEGDETTVNVFPQENPHIPLAEDLLNLRDYYFSFISEENELPPLESAVFELGITKQRKSGYTYYDITWNKPSTDPDALYTLVCYDTDANVYMPVKTLYGDEEAIAKVGTVSKLSSTTLTTCSNSITDADRYFKVFLRHPDGRMQSSEFFYADF